MNQNEKLNIKKISLFEIAILSIKYKRGIQSLHYNVEKH